ncbi:MAG: LysR family transcriptional regulator [Eubacteriales bacterium]
MDISQLQQFIAIVEHNSMRTAADILFVSQPAISWNMKSLETELDTKLFKRENGKSLKLTNNGKVFFDYAKNIIDQTDKMIRNLERSTKMTTVLSCDGNFFYKIVLSELMQKFSDVKIIAKIENYATAISKFVNQEIDILLAWKNKEIHIQQFMTPEYSCIPFYSSKFFLSVPISSIYASKKIISMDDLLQIPLTVADPRSPKDLWIEQIAHQKNKTLQIENEVDEITQLKLAFSKTSKFNILVSSFSIEERFLNSTSINLSNRKLIPIDYKNEKDYYIICRTKNALHVEFSKEFLLTLYSKLNSNSRHGEQIRKSNE